jgi:3,4-dihydroxy-2-butanone 4-phosphate synthase
MAEQTNSGTWTAIGMGLSFAIGILITYIILKPNGNTPAVVTTSTTGNEYPAREYAADTSINREMFAEIQRLNGLIQALSMENAELKLGLNISRDTIASKQETNALNERIQTLAIENAELKRGISISQKAITAKQEPEVKEQAPTKNEPRTITTYKNNEQLVYERDGKTGRVKSIKIIRDAKVNAG